MAPQYVLQGSLSTAFGGEGPPLPGQRRGVRRELERFFIDVVDVRDEASEALAVPGPRGRDESSEPRLAAFCDAVAVVLFVFAHSAHVISFVSQPVTAQRLRTSASFMANASVGSERMRSPGRIALTATAQRPRSGWDVTLNVSVIARTHSRSPADDLALLRGLKTGEPFAW